MHLVEFLYLLNLDIIPMLYESAYRSMLNQWFRDVIFY